MYRLFLLHKEDSRLELIFNVIFTCSKLFYEGDTILLPNDTLNVVQSRLQALNVIL